MPDAADLRAQWARFETVQFAEPTGIPDALSRDLIGKEVPKSLWGLYEAAPELTLQDVPGFGPLVCFGTSAWDGCIGLDPSTGRVVHQMDVPHWQPELVNSSLDQFTASLRAVLDRFPFDSETGEEQLDDLGLEDLWARDDKVGAEWNRAADDLTDTFRRIDPAAVADIDGFWMIFIGDVQMGTFSTRYIVHPPGE